MWATEHFATQSPHCKLILGSKIISAQDEKMPWNPSYLANTFSFHLFMLALTPCPRGQCSSGSLMGSFLVICQTQPEHHTEPSWPCRRVFSSLFSELMLLSFKFNTVPMPASPELHLGHAGSKCFKRDSLSRHLPFGKEHRYIPFFPD